MKKSAICLGLVLVVKQAVVGQMTVLYTNAPDGATVTLSQDVSVTNSPADTANAAGIAFDNGSGSGELAGTGDFSVYNIATEDQEGTGILIGIDANMLVATQYTGNIAVVNDKSSFTSSFQFSTRAFGVEGDVTGDVNGTISATATGGSTSSSDFIVSTFTSASGVEKVGGGGGVYGDVNGSIIATATGGSASSFGSSDLAIAVAEAAASGVSEGYVYGDVNGSIIATAIGGNASSSGSSGRAFAYTSAHGLGGHWIGRGLTGDVNGSIIATAIGGSASSSGSSSAETFAVAAAHGIGGVGIGRGLTGDVNGSIIATATGGSASSLGSTATATATATAAGIIGRSVLISNLTGNISATAIAGLEIENGVTNISTAIAVGIEAEDELYLNATAGSIHAVAAAPEDYGLNDLPADSGAYAILAGNGDDTVLLGNVDIIGDIDLGGGTNRLDILGDTRFKGDILAASGLNDFQITSGLLMPVGHLRVSNLLNNQLDIGAAGGLGFELYEDETSPLNSKLIVDGAVAAESGASIAAWAAEGQSATDIIGNSYEVVTATGGIEGTFSENVDSLFNLDIDVGDTNVVITPTGLRPQDGESTPMGCSVAQVAVASAHAVMDDLSRRTGGRRAMLRKDAAASPTGVQGPDIGERRKMETGEWLAYLHQLNYIGSQDSDGQLAGYDWSTHGFLIGTEKLLNEGFIIGAAGGGAWTDLDGKEGAGGGGSDMFMGSVYGSRFSETWYAEAGLAYAHAGNDAERIAPDTQRYTGEFDSDLFGGWLEGGYAFSKGNNQLEPYARTAYIHGQHDGYTDSGAVPPLTVDSTTTDNWLTELGVRGSHDWLLENEDLVRLTLKAGWRQEWLDNSVSADGQIIDVDIPLDSPASDRSALVLGAKADWGISDALALGIEYEPVVSGNWFYHNISGELSYKF